MGNKIQEIHENFKPESLLNIRGLSGLFVPVKVVNSNILKVFDLLNETYEIVKLRDVSSLVDYKISKNDNTSINPLDVFERLSELETDVKYDFSEYYTKEQCTQALMEAVVPNHADAFKNYHLRELIKWYVDYNKYLDKINEDLDEL